MVGKKPLVLSLFLVLTAGIISSCKKQVPVYKDSTASISARVSDLLGLMTLKEKITMLGGTGFTTQPIKRLGIPAMKMTDGPLGARWGKATAFPAGTAIASTWDTTLVNQVGKAIGREVRGKGRNVILGPNVNIARVPLNGRTFEAYGEDPYLSSELGVSYIKGVQDEHVVATVKHFVANNQEDDRMYVDVNVSQRALHEIYFPAFKAAVQQGDVWAVMSAYNKLYGYYCSASHFLLNKTLKNDWGFKWMVMSDWGGVHNTMTTAKNGLDLEMPTGRYLNNKTLYDAVKSGKIKISVINDKVRRTLRVMFKIGLFDHPDKPNPALVNSKENQQIALKTEEEGIVLLKNRNDVLPLNLKRDKSIAVIGTSAKITRISGGGSAMVTPYFSVSPLQALNQKLGGKTSIKYAPGAVLDSDVQPIPKSIVYTSETGNQHGWTTEYYDSNDFKGKVAVKRIESSINIHHFGKDSNLDLPMSKFKNGFSVRWSGYIQPKKSGDYVFDISSNNGFKLYLNDKLISKNARGFASGLDTYRVHLEASKKYHVRMEYYEAIPGMNVFLVKMGMRPDNARLIREAQQLASKSDVALVFVGDTPTIETEGHDRKSLHLPGDQEALINAVAKANKRTIVVVNAGAPVVMGDWLTHVDGVVEAWYGGEETGNAITNVLTGEVNPSGKLPITFPKAWKDEPAYKTYQPLDSVAHYKEGIFVGYRYFDKNNIQPLFPFGYGLSYTSFAFNNLKVQNSTVSNPAVNISFEIKNTGKTEGTEVAQVYVGENNPKIPRPVKELKKFVRVDLKPGESKVIHLSLNKNAFAYWSPETKKWTVDSGKYTVMVGNSSRKLPLKETVSLK